MSFQFIVVIAIIAAAVVFAGSSLMRKRRAFSTKPGCGHDDCGCGGGGKNLTS